LFAVASDDHLWHKWQTAASDGWTTRAAEGAQLIPLGLPSPFVRYHCKAALSSMNAP
jgi:hypothetical protein